MKLMRGVVVVLFGVLLSGCVGVTLPSTPPGTFADTALLDSLIGQSRDNAYRLLGLPDEAYAKQDRNYILYSARKDAQGVLFILYIPLPTGEIKDSAIHCLRLELDANNLVVKHATKSGSYTEATWGSTFPSCKELFWSDEELQHLDRESVIASIADSSPYLTQLYINGAESIEDPVRQYELYRAGVVNNLEWLCKSAYQKYPAALREIGDIFYYGWYGKAINYQLAYSWYRDARRNGDFIAGTLSDKARAKLSKAQREEAVRLEATWTADQCSKDLLAR